MHKEASGGSGVLEASGGSYCNPMLQVAIAFFVLEAIGSASPKALKVINLAYLLLPSESCPRWRENQTAASNLLFGDRRVKTWPFHSTAVTPS